MFGPYLKLIQCGPYLKLIQCGPPASQGDLKDAGSIPGSGRSPGVGNGKPLQYPCLENSRDRGVRPGRLQSMGLQRVRHDWATEHAKASVFIWYLVPSPFFPNCTSPSTITLYPGEQCTIGYLVLFSYIIHSNKKQYIKQFSEAHPTKGKNSSGIHVK